MFNATQTYKDRLIQRLEEEQDSVLQQNAVPTAHGEGLKRGYYNALSDVIRIIRENDIPPVMQEPIKTKCKAYCPDDKIKSLDC